MSDLQCAATVLLVPVDRARTLGGQLKRARIAHVWASTTPPVGRAAERLASDLGVGVSERTDLDDPEQLDLALAEIADEHRGETVVVLVPDGDAVMEIAIDGDGWVRRPWAGGPG